jgi:hypothetical protein
MMSVRRGILAGSRLDEPDGDGEGSGNEAEADLPDENAASCLVGDCHFVRHDIDSSCNGRIEGIEQEHADEHLDEQCGLVVLEPRHDNPEDGKGGCVQGCPIPDVGNAAPEPAPGAVTDVPEQRVVEGVPDAEEQPHDGGKAWRQPHDAREVVRECCAFSNRTEDGRSTISCRYPDAAVDWD